MKAVFPGKPQATLHALSSALWEGQRFLAYISNNALIVLDGPNRILQTIIHADHDFLNAVAICDSSGKIATCTNSTIYVYRPLAHHKSAPPTWVLQHTLTSSTDDRSLACLSWGLSEELLASGTHATLYSTVSEQKQIWSRPLANSAKFAVFAPCASFIASTGWHDRLVKVWQRIFLGVDEERFDISYLPHPSAVTSLRWHHRRPDYEHPDTSLYTTAADGKLRVWAATDHHALQPLQLWSELDLNQCILPRSPSSAPASNFYRYVFIVDSWEFESMVEYAIHHRITEERDQHIRKHLLDVAYRNPDICVVMDDHGNMSAWGLERVGHKARQPNDIFNVLLAEHVDFHPAAASQPPSESYLSLCNFAGVNDGTLNVVSNLFGGAIQWLSSPVDQFFHISASAKRFHVDAIWTGPAEPIHCLVSSVSHNTLLSIGSQQELVVWTQNYHSPKAPLRRSGACHTPHAISLASFIDDDSSLILVHQNIVSLWNISGPVPTEVASCDTGLESEPTCLVVLPRRIHRTDDEFIALFAKDTSALAIRVTRRSESSPAKLELFAPLHIADNIDIPDVQSIHAVKKYRNKLDSDPVVYSIASSGQLTLWASKLDLADPAFSLTPFSNTATFVENPAMTQVDAHGKAAVVSATRDELAIWDTILGHLEHVETFKSHESIEAIDLTCTQDCHALLAVASLRKARIYSQDRYSYVSNGNSSSSWALLKTVDIGLQTNMHMSACIWLTNHDLLLAAGNQMFLFDNHAEIPDCVQSSLDLRPGLAKSEPCTTITNALNSVPAIFTTELNAQMLSAGNLDMIDFLLNKLRSHLKFWSPGDELNSFLGVGLEHYLQLDEALVNENSSQNGEYDDHKKPFSADSAVALNEILDAIDLPFVSDTQQLHLSNLADSVGFFEKHRGAVDSFGMRYLVDLHQHVEAPPAGRLQLPWRDIVWAFHSGSQDILIDLTSRMYQGRMVWKDAHECGLFLWAHDADTVRAQFEVIARNEYTKTDERNPLDCSLYYLALRKKNVLEGLWRLATWNRERNATLRLLSQDFTEARWKTAALKNAYALLGLRRFEYAAAFFLLADHLKDAVSVLVRQVNDIQLAVAVARVYEGDNGSVLTSLLRETVLPQAAAEGDRWLATWTYWMLHEKHMALRALAEPLDSLMPLSTPAPISSKHYRTNEPALAPFFAHLRAKIAQTPGDKTPPISPRAEWNLVKRSAIAYVRAGCHILALDLVRNWKFADHTTPQRGGNVTGLNATATGVKYTSAMDGPRKGEAGAEAKMNGSVLPERVKVYEEPSAASILDNFNF